ncbi:hypothetical protein SADUNF_Sadunf17G0122500 [Salix dunnii]|uniref:non-specific serine/threonine protein kinase n=1 Tax=Salix dunnii TaxID=1413687 RepID=A0A835MHR1_9ROSI|nr:hypothetical protein SADUNF_Sadunf17G0122500 [Salix dunnii]
MGGNTNLDFSRFLVLISFCLSLTYAAEEISNSNMCPMDLSYVLRIPWNRTLCQDFNPPAQNDNTNTTSKHSCCQTLLSLLGVALAQHLKETSLFQLPDLATSISCLQDYQSKLSSFYLSDNLLSYCFNPLQFVTSPNICARIETSQDWVDQLGNSTSLDTECRSDLTDLTACDSCLRAGYKVQSLLLSADGNHTHAQDCFYFAVLYAAGIVNEFGPESDGVVSCIFGLDLNSSVDSASNSHSALVFGLTGAGVAILVMSSLLGLYLWYDKKWRRKRSLGFGFDLNEQGSRPKLRPNTGSIWFKIQELEKATDGFSQKNFIGRGGFGFVYKGVLSDGTVVAIKRVIESDFQGDAEFCNEVEIISNLKHRNLVPLRGCCVIDDDVNSDERGTPRALLITDWAWSLVKAGKVDQALDASLLRELKLNNCCFITRELLQLPLMSLNSVSDSSTFSSGMRHAGYGKKTFTDIARFLRERTKLYDRNVTPEVSCQLCGQVLTGECLNRPPGKQLVIDA